MTSKSTPLPGIEFNVSPRLFRNFSLEAARLGLDVSTAVEVALEDAVTGMREERERRRAQVKQVREGLRAGLTAPA